MSNLKLYKICSLNNNSLMSIFFVLIIPFLLLFIVQLTAKARVFFDVSNNIGYIQLKFVGIKIFSRQISIKCRCLKITKDNGKSKYFPLEINKEQFEEYTIFPNILFRKIYFKNVGVIFNFGVDSNPFLVAIITEIVDIISKISYTVFKTKKSETNITLKINPNFDSNVINFGFKAKISISIYDLIWSFAEAKTKKMLRRKSQNANN